jgi:myosin heavy subunit
MPTAKEIERKRSELMKDSKNVQSMGMGGPQLNAAGQAALDKFKGTSAGTAASAPTPVDVKYSPEQRNKLTDQYNTIKNQIDELTKSKADRDREFKEWSADRKKDYDSFLKDMNYETGQANKIKDGKEKANRMAEINAEKANRKKEYDAEIATRQKELTAIPTQIADLNKQLGTVNKEYTAATKEYATIQAQAKKLGMDVGEYENQIYGQTQQRQQEADFAKIAAERGMTVDQLKQVQNQKLADTTLEQQKAAKAAEDQAAAQAQAARMAQVQAAQQDYAKAMAQRKAQNDAQVYQLLTQNMPSPVGYSQGPTSRQAQTTMIGAGGEQSGMYGPPQQQMSPAQIAQMSQMRGMPPQGIAAAQQLSPQQIAALQAQQMQQAPQQQAPQTQQAPVMAAYGGIMRSYR